MMRYIRYALISCAGIVIATVALANRAIVELRLLPRSLGELFGMTGAIRMPLFLVILGSVALGVLIGFLWEWIRAHNNRAEAARKAREAARLEKEVTQLRDVAGVAPKDDVLALLEGSAKAG